ncbi:MAG: hypothetical protein SWO11_17275 [Thermodesulfobacteriota bacterium]|nr:hypothetical protein [Thermodesulfobacteriota bacterium]
MKGLIEASKVWERFSQMMDGGTTQEHDVLLIYLILSIYSEMINFVSLNDIR